MNIISFLGLLRAILGRKLPDLEKIQKKGLLAVKIAQHFALRIDFLDEKVCRHLSKLFRQTITLPPEDTKNLLEAYVDNKWSDNIKDFVELIKTLGPLNSDFIGTQQKNKSSAGKSNVDNTDRLKVVAE